MALLNYGDPASETPATEDVQDAAAEAPFSYISPIGE